MLTRMGEEDWTVTLEAFHAARPRRGDKGRDDRRFLEALHYSAVHNVTWRALPAEFGNWNSGWKRFWRLSVRGSPAASAARRALRGRTTNDRTPHHHAG